MKLGREVSSEDVLATFAEAEASSRRWGNHYEEGLAPELLRLIRSEPSSAWLPSVRAAPIRVLRSYRCDFADSILRLGGSCPRQ